MAHALAGLKQLSLLEEHDRPRFLSAVARQLCDASGSAATPILCQRFGLDFLQDDGPAALLLCAKLLLCRIASRRYQETGAVDALLADLATAGLGRAASWLCVTAEAAVSQCAGEMRTALAHETAAMSHGFLVDHDWQVRRRSPRFRFSPMPRQ
jgi:hypothetical protein